jgi:DNA-directed RNA polymerase specialized sigma24 family protein
MHYVKVQNADGREVTVEVTDEVFLVFEDERRELQREKKEKTRHLSKNEMVEDIVPRRSVMFLETPEDQVCLLESFHEILESCTPNQKRRFSLYLRGYSISEIARFQHTSIPAVLYSLTNVLKRIKKIL